MENKQQNQQKMKIGNRQLVLSIIKKEGELSRADLAKRLKMSPTSMTRIYYDLKELNLIQEGEKQESQVGRKAVILRPNPDAFYSLGILLRTDFISLMILNYVGEVLYTKQFEMVVSNRPDETVNQVIFCIEKAKRNINVDWDKVKSVGVSVPGIIKGNEGLVEKSNLFEWTQVPLGKMLEKRLRLPVILETDVKASIMEEYEGNCEFQVPHLGFLSLSLGLGAAFFKDGKLLRGAHGGCGEISHKLLVFKGRQCQCGKLGCAAAYLSTHSILDQAERLSGRKISLGDLKKAYIEEQLWAKGLIEELSGYLAILINECLIYQNPDILILAGRTIQELPFLLEKALEKKEYFHTYLLERTKIVISKGNGMESVKGSAYLAIRQYEEKKLRELL